MRSFFQRPYIDRLPQETLEAIIDELAEDKTSLMACCLVNRRWIRRSRKHLFRKVRLSGLWGPSSLGNWGNAMNLDGTPAALTRSLRISQREAAWITPLNLILYFEHFRSFNRVESLTLSYFSCRIFDHVILGFLFRNLIPSVHRLRLHRPIACPTSLLRLISIFPNLRNTVIHAPHWEPIAQRDRHATARYHLHGELYLSDLDEESGPFISLLGSQRTEYERLTLERCGFRDFLPLQQLVSSAGMSLRNLYLFAEGNQRREVPKISLSECMVLESLFISVVGPEASFRRIASMYSSVVSPHFRRLVLEATLREFPDIYCDATRTILEDGVSRLDRPLCTLAKRIIREDEGELLFILLTHNALELAQNLTELNKDGGILVGEKVIGGEHSCVYIPAMTSLQEALNGKAGRVCDVEDFL